MHGLGEPVAPGPEAQAPENQALPVRQRRRAPTTAAARRPLRRRRHRAPVRGGGAAAPRLWRCWAGRQRRLLGRARRRPDGRRPETKPAGDLRARGA